MNFVLANLDWNNWKELWKDPSIQIQFSILIGLIVFVFALTKLTKPLVISLSENNENSDLKKRFWNNISRMVAPLYLLTSCLLAVAVVERFSISSQELIRPFTSAAGAWATYRMISGFIKSRAWLRLIAVLAFGLAALHSFGLLETTIELLNLLAFNVGDRRISILDIMNGGIILLILLWVSSLLGSSGEKKIRKLPHLPPSLQVLLAKILRVILVFVSFAIALSTIGLDLSSFAILGGAIGVGIGFGLQKVVSNLVSGLILLLDRSIKPGDVIEIEGTYGWINSLRARYASVITRDGKEHLIPNEDLITNRVINWSFSDRNVRVRVPIGISYNADPRKAIELCLDAANSTNRTLRNPPPKCLLTGFGDNSVDLELRFWIDDPSNGVGNVRSEVLLAIWDRLQEAGIEIPFPQRDINISGLSPEIMSALKEEIESPDKQAN
jgi:small-conductance mechanosensitive channel